MDQFHPRMNRRYFLAASTASLLAQSAAFAAVPRKQRVAVIGDHGDFGHDLDRLWLGVPETEIIAVSDPDAGVLAGRLRDLGVTQGFADYREMLEKTQPEIVAIGPRQITHHHEMAMAAAKSGAKGIYMEKPFCRTLAEADEIISACEKHNVRLALAHRNRYHPVLPTVAALVNDGRIGRLLEVRCRGKEDARGGGLDLWVLGSHVLNVALIFTGPPAACSATLFQGKRPATPTDIRDGAEGVGPLAGDALHARFDTGNGVPIYFESVKQAGNAAVGFGLQLIGTQGIIDLRMDQGVMAHHLAGNPFQPSHEPRAWQPISTGGIGIAEPLPDTPKQVSSHLLTVRDLLGSIRENRAPLCSAADGRTVLEMTMGVFSSHVKGGARVALPLEDRRHPLASWK
jgi:predicted dehydrogenase